MQVRKHMLTGLSSNILTERYQQSTLEEFRTIGVDESKHTLTVSYYVKWEGILLLWSGIQIGNGG